MSSPVDVDKELSKLKDFQRRTVDYVFRRMYEDDPPARRFLVADEVGLGKTMVARGVIAKAIEHLHTRVDRVDIVYVCSNAAIAQQNLNRLNILGKKETSFATRLTLLPSQLGSLSENKINFISFTPGTTFDLKSRGGTVQERAVLYRMLDGQLSISSTRLRNLLQGHAGYESWGRHLDAFGGAISPELSSKFRDALAVSPVLPQLMEAAERFKRWREHPSQEDNQLRFATIGALRQLLARVCVDALEPDLVILDEFQRFKDVLDGEDEAAELARHLFDYKDVRVLLLSATPYRMLTLPHEQHQDDHHGDFLRTCRFLQGGDEHGIEDLERELASFRRSLLSTHDGRPNAALASRDAIEKHLRAIMSRTERVGATEQRDSMVRERVIEARLQPGDVEQALAADRVSHALGTGDVVEYWKSAPYLLNFMQSYKLKEKLRAQADSPSADLLAAVQAAGPQLLERDTIAKYLPVAFANARLRAIAEETLDHGQWKLLWLPPSLPYLKPTGVYSELKAGALTKSLIFSSWGVVPEAIASLLSYEAERLMVGDAGRESSYEKLRVSRKPLLTFKVDAEGRPTGMPALALLYPCCTLAQHVDPLSIALDVGNGEPAELEVVQQHVSRRLGRLVDEIVLRHGNGDTSGPVDQRWYWALPVLLDAKHQSNALDWIDSEQGLRGLFHDAEEDEPSHREEGESRTGFDRHVDELLKIARGDEKLGRRPDDLLKVIADFALASPAVCAVRATRRVTRLVHPGDPHVMTAAAQVAKGFRVLFNVPETMELLRADDEERTPYWRHVLQYCVGGNLQAVLDEYAHLLVESEGVMGQPGAVIAQAISKAMIHALSPRTATLSFDDVKVRPVAKRIELTELRVRCRFALRFGDRLRDESDPTLARAEVVRDAFNSPFRPFVLASTSVGQEGLDFHHYCHAVVHWNLPTNPVDLEQREGRVHRYKGHAVRRNLAAGFGLKTLIATWGGDDDPWSCLFKRAADTRPAGQSDLYPYWLCDGPEAVERRIPLLPLSREHGQLARLKKNLALYRLVFGQPRQDDLLAYLAQGSEDRSGTLEQWRVSLTPPL